MKVYPLIVLVLFLLFISCNLKKEKKHENTIQNENYIKEPTLQKEIDFFKVIKELEEINFFVIGRDSVIITKNPLDLTELNTLKQAFYSPFDSTEIGLNKYKKVDFIKKYHIKKMNFGKSAPSANVIQLNFKNLLDAQSWFNSYDKSIYKKIIENKPKTTLWLDKNKIYFVQTYMTPNREPLNLIKSTIVEKLNRGSNESN